MTLTAGSRLGPYEILSPIGAGGMGEVYKARDTRLERTVAIKVLPERSVGRPRMLASASRREAKTISQLSTIRTSCALYDVGQGTERPYLAMEYLEGETLRERLADRPAAAGAAPRDRRRRSPTRWTRRTGRESCTAT